MSRMRNTALFFALLSLPAFADGLLHGTVVSVADGDTIRFETAHGGRIKVRLAQIDAPEKSQPGGKASQVNLGEMCMQQPATLAITDQDRYGRLVAMVTCNGVDANREQIRRGMAWVYTKYATDPDLPGIEAEARDARRGLWAEDAVPPWEWRSH